MQTKIQAIQMLLFALVFSCSGTKSIDRSGGSDSNSADSSPIGVTPDGKPVDGGKGLQNYNQANFPQPITGTNLWTVVRGDCLVNLKSPCNAVRYSAVILQDSKDLSSAMPLERGLLPSLKASGVRWEFDSLPAGSRCRSAGVFEFHPVCSEGAFSEHKISVKLVLDFIDGSHGTARVTSLVARPEVVPGVDGIAFWISADSLTGVLDGDQVVELPDLTGNGFAAIQSDPPKRPVYSAHALGGLPALSFGNSLRGLNSGFRASQRSVPSLSIVAVARIKTIDGNYRNIASFDGTTGGWNRGLGVWDNGSFYGQGGAQGNFAKLDNTVDPNGWKVIILTYSSVVTLRVGVDVASSATTEIDTGHDNSLSIGYAPTGSPESQAFIGDIAEVMILNKALSEPERQTIEGYFHNKYFGR